MHLAVKGQACPRALQAQVMRRGGRICTSMFSELVRKGEMWPWGSLMILGRMQVSNWTRAGLSLPHRSKRAPQAVGLEGCGWGRSGIHLGPLKVEGSALAATNIPFPGNPNSSLWLTRAYSPRGPGSPTLGPSHAPGSPRAPTTPRSSHQLSHTYHSLTDLCIRVHTRALPESLSVSSLTAHYF